MGLNFDYICFLTTEDGYNKNHNTLNLMYVPNFETNNLMEETNYLEPDEIWKIFGVKSEKDFKGKYLLQGKFHSLVPEEIISDYKIVERLTYYSYFNYPLIDEAFSKSTRIFEASITLKLEMLGLKKDRFETLTSKLNRLKELCSNDLFEQWKIAKKFRNDFAHREAGVLMGISLINALKHNLNLINSVFLESSTILNKENNLKNLLQQSKHLEKGLFILEYKNTKILISGARPFTTGIINNLGKSLWVFIPIVGSKIIQQLSDFPNPIILKLENVEIIDKGLKAIDTSTQELIQLTSTEKAENIEKLKLHNQIISEVENESPNLSLEYMAILKHKTVKEIANFLYEDW